MSVFLHSSKHHSGFCLQSVAAIPAYKKIKTTIKCRAQSGPVSTVRSPQALNPPLYSWSKGLLSLQHLDDELSPLFFHIIRVITLRQFNSAKFNPHLKNPDTLVVHKHSHALRSQFLCVLCTSLLASAQHSAVFPLSHKRKQWNIQQYLTEVRTKKSSFKIQGLPTINLSIPSIFSINPLCLLNNPHSGKVKCPSL